VKYIKRMAALCVLAVPAAAFAAGTVTGTVQLLTVDNSKGDLVYVSVAGVETGSPIPGCDRTPPYQFVLPRSNQLQADLLTLLLKAMEDQTTVTLVGVGTCQVDPNLETLASVTS